jgi:hypothetical protein
MRHFFLILIFILMLALTSFAAGGSASAATINTNIPGTAPTTSPAGFVANFYQFSLMLGGLLAFAAIVYGAIIYTISAGNPEKQSEGKDRILQALLGLALLMGAVLIINYVNPDIITHPAGSATFTLKDVNLESLKARTRGTLKYDPVSPVNYAEKDVLAKAARREVERLEGDLTRMNGDLLNAQLAGNTAEAARLERAIAAKEQEITSKRALASAMRYDLSARVALEGGDTVGAQAYQDALNRKLGTAAVNLNAAGDKAGAANLITERFKHNAQLDADAAVRNAAKTPADAPFDETGMIMRMRGRAETQAKSVMEKIVADAKAQITQVEKLSPGSGQKIRDEAKIAIDKIKTACTQKALDCKDFTYDLSK